MILSRKSGKKFFQRKQSGRQSIKAPKTMPVIWRRSIFFLLFGKGASGLQSSQSWEM